MLAFPQNNDPNSNEVIISVKTLARSLFTSKETNPPHGRGTVSGRRGAVACCNSAIARRRRRPRERGGFHRSHGFFSGRAERGGLESLAKAEAAVAANWEKDACARGEGATVLLL